MKAGPMSEATEVLLVEDDRDVREAIAEVLEQEGYRATTAKTGLEALQHLEACPKLPAAILLDLMMPVMDGWEFWAIKQTNPHWAGVPVVIVSADANVAQRAGNPGEQSRQNTSQNITPDTASAPGGSRTCLRAAAYLRKPIDIDQLLGILRAIAGRTAPAAPSSTVLPTVSREDE